VLKSTGSVGPAAAVVVWEQLVPLLPHKGRQLGSRCCHKGAAAVHQLACRGRGATRVLLDLQQPAVGGATDAATGRQPDLSGCAGQLANSFDRPYLTQGVARPRATAPPSGNDSRLQRLAHATDAAHMPWLTGTKRAQSEEARGGELLLTARAHSRAQQAT